MLARRASYRHVQALIITKGLLACSCPCGAMLYLVSIWPRRQRGRRSALTQLMPTAHVPQQPSAHAPLSPKTVDGHGQMVPARTPPWRRFHYPLQPRTDPLSLNRTHQTRIALTTPLSTTVRCSALAKRALAHVRDTEAEAIDFLDSNAHGRVRQRRPPRRLPHSSATPMRIHGGQLLEAAVAATAQCERAETTSPSRYR